MSDVQDLLLPLTAAQSGIWFAQELDPANAIYNAGEYLEIRGKVDAGLFEDALRRVLVEAECLRVRFTDTPDGPRQRIVPAGEWWLPVLDVSAAPDPRAAAELRMWDLLATPRDIRRDPLFDFVLFRLADDHYLWLHAYHHSAVDGFTVSLVARRTAEVYTALAAGDEPGPTPFAPLGVLVDADIAYRASDRFTQDRAYWADRMAGAPAPAGLSGGRPATPHRLERRTAHLDRATADALRDLARAAEVPWPPVVAAAFAAYLQRCTGGEEIVLGMPVTTRLGRTARSVPGMVSNVLPLRLAPHDDMTVGALLRHTSAAMRGDLRHQRYRYEDLRRDLNLLADDQRLVGPQVNIMMFDYDLTFAGHRGIVHNLSVGPADDMSVVVYDRTDGNGLQIDLDANPELYTPDAIDAHLHRFLRYLRELAAAGPDRVLGTLGLVDEAERALLLDTWNDTARPVPAVTLTELLAAQAHRTPDSTALLFEDTAVSYAELDDRASRLARLLVARGVRPERFVAVAVPRSVELVVALLAVLKAGAAYLPVDPGYPADRIAFLLQDADPVLTLTTSEVAADLPDTGTPPLVIDTPATVALLSGHGPEQGIPLPVPVPANPAYVIYTSGSTGRPKGAVVPHAGIVNRLLWMQDHYRLTPEDRVLQKTPSGFDVSVWEFFWPLITGAALVVARPEGHKDPQYLAELIRARSVTTTHFVPSMLQAFLAEPTAADCTSLRRVICSGEALPATLRDRFHTVLTGAPGAELHNLYGPTEASVDVTWWQCGPDDKTPSVPIGRPVWNTRLYVLDARLRPVPAGAPGELYLAGVQLARGYLRRSGLTASRFVADPFGADGARMYRTGDVVRWSAGGDLEYLGRSDDQVKLRGFRIELGEIEAAVLDHPEVEQAAVVVREDRPGSPAVVAYVVAGGAAGGVDVAALRVAVAGVLPDYMVPSAFVVLGALPLSPNGKLDRRALPAPDFAGSAAGGRAARTPREAVLCGLFAQVLGLDEVAADASFFDLGGDSIMSIQLVSRARTEGLVLTTRDVFRLKTVEALAEAAVEDAGREVVALGSEPGGGVGGVVVPPVVEWLRGLGSGVGGFHQSVLVSVPGGVGLGALTAAVQGVVDHHDALRLRLLVGAGGGWGLEVGPVGSVPVEGCVRRVDVSAGDGGVLSELVRVEADAARGRLAPELGVMVQVVWFDAGAGRAGRLLWVVHHLAVDGVSWRVLLPDLEAAWRQVAAGGPVALEPVGTSYRAWAGMLPELAADRADELALWQGVLAEPDGLLGARALDPVVDVAGTAGSVTVEVPAEVSQGLLSWVPGVWGAGVEEVLLAALGVAVSRWRGGGGHVLVDLEGHGREQLVDGWDLSRTVGWFTSRYPVRLDVEGLDVSGAVKRVKEAVRALPDRGVGFGLLRYLDAASSRVLAGLAEPQVGFNYLGRFRAGGGEGDWLPVGEAGGVGGGVDPAMRMPHALEVNALALDGVGGPVLSAVWAWPGGVFGEGEVEALAREWVGVLASLVGVAGEPGEGGLTPSDVLAEVSQADIEVLEETYPGLQDVLPLSPLQEGLHFHALDEDAGSAAYTVQIGLGLEGELDTGAMRRAAEALLDRHAGLRAGFVHEGLDAPVQVIASGAPLPWSQQDLRGLPAAERDAALARILDEDRARRFDPADPPLLRFTAIRLDEDHHHLVLTYDHLLLDGWSTAVLMRELFALYANGSDTGALPRVTPFREHLDRLARQDRPAADEAWRTALAGLDEPTLLAEPARSDAPAPGHEQLRVELTEERTRAVGARARALGITLNTVVQGSWGLTLARLTGREDVVFGATVSGRPADLPGIEDMVGLFINTLPVSVRVRPADRLADLLTAVQDEQARLMPHQHVRLTDVQRLAGHGELFDSIAVFENYPVDALDLGSPDGRLRVTGIDGGDTTHYPLTLIAVPGDRLQLRLGYRTDLIGKERAERFLNGLLSALDAVVADAAQPTGRVDLLTAAEREQLLVHRNDTAVAVPGGTVADAFQRQAAATPDAVAVLFEGTAVSYAELDDRASRLARLLVARGAGPEQFVAVAMERTADLLVSVLAVLKAGAAYLPVDPGYPADRIAFLLQDADPVLTLTTSEVATGLPDTGTPLLLLDAEPTAAALRAASGTPLTDADRTLVLRPANPAYVIYTSGSTGRPKGVVVSHESVVGFASWAARELGPDALSRVLFSTSLNFDVSVLEIFGPLLSGGCAEVVRDVLALADEPYETWSGSLVSAVPSAFDQLLTHSGLAARAGLVVLAGEALPARLVDRIRRTMPDAGIANLYGPTEATVYSTGWYAGDGPTPSTPPIGRPISNRRVYVLDTGLRPVPPGVRGELYLAGPGLARGYGKRPGLTASRFVADPFGADGARMYRTGDVVRWSAGGDLEYLGRSDDQVKVRGFRMELGEIESAVASHPGVGSAAVVVREDRPGVRAVVAYVVPENGAAGGVDVAALRVAVAGVLPDYMVPSAFVVLGALPLSPNGKLDRRALPAPDFAGSARGRAARTPREAVLCGLFAQVLGLDEVAADASFFDLGGDSIMSIQVAGRARRAGLSLRPRDVFRLKTVEAMAAVLDERGDEPVAGPADPPGGGVGGVVVPPVVEWLRGLGSGVGGFHQSVLVSVPADVGVGALTTAVQGLMDHHDALRLRLLVGADGGWGLEVGPVGSVSAGGCVRRVDVSGGDGGVLSELVRVEADAARGRLAPELGVMVQVVWFDAGVGRAGRLLWVVHHLAVDGVSWRVLLPDLEVAWGQVAAGGPVVLEPVGTSYRAWAGLLPGLAADRVGELALWEGVLAEPDGLLGSRVLDPVVDVAGSAGSVTVEVPAGVSSALLSWVPGVWGAGVEEVLLAALGVAVCQWREGRGGGGGHVLVDLEGHGREQVVDGLDLSRTVGWFTSRYPVRLDVGGVGVGGAVKRVKEVLRGLPDRGMGFGLLRYVDEGSSRVLAGLAEPQVGFNYLGRFRAGEGEGDWLPVGEAGGVGGGVDPAMRMPHALEVNALALDGVGGPVLSAVWAWPGGVFGEGEVESLAREWVGVLASLVGVAGEPGAGGLTPSDVLAEVSQADIEVLEEAYPGLQDVLPLSPLQEGLHFHALYDSESPDLYAIQLVFDLEGDFDADAMRRSATTLLRRRPNLRAAFVNQESGSPVQVIPADVEVPWADCDLRGLDAGEREAEATRILDEDRAIRFDPARPPLLRFTAIRLDDRHHRLVLTNHHLLWDGWSVPVLVRELFELYAHGGDGSSLALPAQFREHLDWLARQDRPAADEAWRTALAGLDEPTLLAGPARHEPTAAPAGLPERLSVRLPEPFTSRLHAWARSRGLTLNTVLQGTWALLLSRLTGREDVVFGATVSGRPADLPGVEDMTGLFSNTLPVRVVLDRAASLGELLERIQEEQAELLDHHHVGLAEIGARTGLGELFDTLLVFENYPLDPATLDLPGTGLRAAGARVRDAAHYPLSLAVVPGEGLELRFDYRPESFTADRVAALGDRLRAVLELIVTDPERPVGRVGVLTADEAERLGRDRRASDREVALLPFPDLFEGRVARNPDTVAVVHEETPGHCVELTYAELDARANRLARLLIGRGIGPEDVVGLLLPRSVDQVVAVLAVSKAGAAYLPIDPAYPADRIAYVVGDARPALLLVDPVTGRRLPEIATSTPALVLGGDIAPDLPGHRPAAAERRGPLTLDSPAYVIYTSGSTGRPKGVVVTHRGVANLAGSQIERFAVEEGSRVLQVASPSFDAAFSELCLALLSGSTLVLAPADRLLPGAGLTGLIARQRITHATIPPAALAALDGDGLPPGMVLTVAGEACSPALVDQWSRDRRMINAYGPTETTVCATMSEPLAPSGRRTPPPIGRAVWNTRVHVLDGGLGAVPPGAPGELYVAGPGLARGYLGRSALTASRFVADPFAADGSRMYRTGDVVRRLDDGQLEFVGRVDDQVKLRGFRIELGEVEAAVLDRPEVEQVAVVVREDRPGSPAVVAYVVPDRNAAVGVDVAALRVAVAGVLPDYMVPSAFVVLDVLPLTVHGKVDRRALPAPELVVGGRGPRTAREEILCGLFGEVLGVEGVGAEDGFFDLGGHSLLATRLVSRVRSVLGVELPVRALFENPTVAALDRTLDDAARARKALAPLPRPAQVPLSFGQRRLWFLERFESAGGSVSMAVRLTGELDADALRLALGDLVARHEALRTVFPDDDGVPRQQVLDFWVPALGLVDVTEAELDAEVRDAVSVPVDLAVDPPLRARLLRLGEREHVLLLVVHHIAADGWSLAPLARDLSAAYAARLGGGVPEWRPLPVQYADYTVWQREVLGDETDPESPIARQLSYWYEALSGLPDEIDLPADRPRPPVPGYRGGTVEFAFDADLHQRLTVLAREANVSLFMVLQAGLATLLNRLGAGDDIPLGTPVAGRTDEALDDLIGFFVNTLVLRTDVSGDPTFLELLGRVRETDLAAFAHQDVPFERLVEVLNPARSLARHPLFQVMLALQNAPEGTLRLPGLDATPLPPVLGDAKFDLGVELVERRDSDGAPAGLLGLAHYSADRFDEGTVRLLTERFGRWLAAVAASPGTRVGAFDVLSASERDTVLHRWNATGHELPEGTLPVLFEEQAARTPDAVAVLAADQEMTYAELNARANRLARLLAGRGAGPESLVAVAVPRSVRWLVALLAVAKAGAGYLPVDPAQPAARIEGVIADARPVLVLTENTGNTGNTGNTENTGSTGSTDSGEDSVFSAAPLAASVAALPIEEAERLAAGLDGTDLSDADRTSPLRPEHPAYVIYTSGSTGRPKGVLVTHASIGNLAAVHIDRLGVDAGSRVLQAVSTTFDPSVADTVMALLSGAALVLADPRRHIVGDQLAEAVSRYGVTHLQLAAPVLATVPDAGLDTLRCIVTGGEACSAELVTRWARGGRRVVNAYGPTEMTVATTMSDPLTGESTPPIGRAVWNTRAYVLDGALGLVTPGVAGELYVSGAGLARGYLGRSALTASRFVADPFAADGSRMYRTGDVVRHLHDGQLEFVGRTDDQAKIRGHRIEPGEVEAVVAAVPGVGQAAVVVREDPARGAHLVAYVVPAEGLGGALDVGVLRVAVAGVLPDYMVPSAFVVLDVLPLTVHGKVDRRALPAPELVVGGRGPRTAREEILCGLFGEVLGVEGVGAEDGFFDLGGHSLLATRLVSRVRSVLGVELPVRALFENPTVAALDRTLDDAGTARRALAPVDRGDTVPLSFAQRRLWFLNRFEENSSAYNVPMAVRLTGELDVDALRLALGDVLARHEALRTVFPEDRGRPSQLVLPPRLPDFEAEPLAEDDLTATLAGAANTGFALDHELPLRIQVFRTGEQEHVLLLVLHHIAADGWSLAPLARDLSAAYAARLGGGVPQWRPLPVQYADYTVWQREVLGDETDPESPIARQLSYWYEALSGLPDEIALPADRPRPQTPSRIAGSAEVALPPAVHRDLAALAREANVSLFMVLQAGLAALLNRLGAGDDIPLGSLIAGRTDEALDDLVGFFVNTLVLRTDVSGDPTFLELLDRVRETDLAAYAHQDVPFERLVEVLNPARSLARHPLFQVMLSFQNAEDAELGLPGLSVEPLRVGLDAAKFDLSFNLEERLTASGEPDGIGGRIEFAAELFDPETVELFAARLVRLLSAVAADPAAPVGALDVAGPGELRRVVGEWGIGRGQHPLSDATPAALFEEQVARTPLATAVVAPDATLTFAELDERASLLARSLTARGVTAESLVATALPRSAALVTLILAVLKAGGGYVPLDPDHPAERIGRILGRTRPRLVVTGPEGLPEGVRTADEVLTLDELAGTRHGTDDLPPAVVRPDAPAYVIHTSGSTGTPKGVLVSHRSLSGLFRAMRERVYGPSAGGTPLRAAHFAPFSFDASVDQLLWLFDGHELHVLDEETRTDPDRLVRYLADRRIGALSTTPSYAARLVDRGLLELPHGLRALALGAEAVPEPLWRRLAATPGLAAFNLYGPTECTVDSVVARIGAGRPVIGSPVPDTAALVLDGRLRPALPGVTGELYLSGPALARGYVGEPALTGGRFVACPYGPPGSRMYRTGDLVRWRDGALEYVGRADDQVKIRGFRVELGEVESALAGRTGVLQAAAVVREDRPGVRQLAAYAVARPGVPLDPARLRAELARELPDYMVPASVTVLDALPLTTSGKVDRRALPAPRTGGDGGRAPRPGREELLARLFAEVLGLDDVGAESSFFDLGGDSIVSIELVSRARAHRLVFSPRDVFRHRTVAALAAAATEQEGTGVADPEDVAVGDVVPLPIVHDLWERGGPVAGVNQATLLTVPPDLGEARLVAAVQTLLDHHGALRLRLTPGEAIGLTVAEPGAVPAGPLVRRREVTEATGEALAELIRAEGEAARGRLAPEAGVAVQVVWFDAGPARPGRLLLVLHHLAVDGVSWRILVPDLVTAWQAAADGAGAGTVPEQGPRTGVLPPEGTSYRRWTQHLARLAEDPARLAELPLWRRMSAGPDPLLGSRPLDPAQDTVERLRSVTVELAADRAEPLLTTVPAVFRAGVNDVLLTGLTLALAHWRGSTGRGRGTGALVELESHGREDLVEGVDLSRTVGWFTSSHPLWLDPGPLDVAEALAAGPAAGRALKRIKEQLRAVPDHGIGYGLLRRLNPATAAELSAAPAPQIGFNYLGRFSADPVGGHWTPAPETASLPAHADPGAPLPHVLEINAAAHDGADGPRLSATLSWPDGLLSEAEVRELAESWLMALEALVTHAQDPDAGGWTPSDVALTSLTQSQIDHVLAGDDEGDEEDEEDDMDSFWRDAR